MKSETTFEDGEQQQTFHTSPRVLEDLLMNSRPPTNVDCLPPREKLWQNNTPRHYILHEPGNHFGKRLRVPRDLDQSPGLEKNKLNIETWIGPQIF